MITLICYYLVAFVLWDSSWLFDIPDMSVMVRMMLLAFIIPVLFDLAFTLSIVEFFAAKEDEDEEEEEDK